MTAGGLLHPVTQTNAVPFAPPMALIDGKPDARFHVQSLSSVAPLDERTASITCSNHQPVILDPNAMIEIAWPYELWDQSAAWLPFVIGRFVYIERDIPSPDATWQLQDAWTQSLQRGMTDVLGDAVDQLAIPSAAVFAVGDQANRSHEANIYPESSIYLPNATATGISWSFGDALQTLNLFSSLQLDLSLLPLNLRHEPLRETIHLTSDIRKALEALLTQMNAVIIRSLSKTDGQINEHRIVLPRQATPCIEPNLDEHEPRLRRLFSWQPNAAARRWIAYGNRPEIEATLELVGGWNPTMENQPGDTYSRKDAVDFHTVRDVYRRWVLNEHGGWSVAPFNRPQTFHAASFFDQPEATDQALRLRNCLTLDAGGRSRGVIVQISVDGGLCWQAYPGRFSVLNDEAGVYLDDDALPTDILAAALAGDLRVRVTATLRSPLRLSVSRWSGNAFRGVDQPVELEAGDRFTLRQIATSSLHHTLVSSGQADANISDETIALKRWLLERLEKQPIAKPDQWAWQFDDARPWLTAGKRLILNQLDSVREMMIQRAVMQFDDEQSHISSKIELQNLRSVHS